MNLLRASVALGVAAAAILAGSLARAQGELPPWVDPGDVPLPDWARSVAPLRARTELASAAGYPDLVRGTASPQARLPLFGTKRASGCTGRWFLVGPLAWVCADAADLSRDPVTSATPRHGEMPFRYFYVGTSGADVFLNEPRAADAPDESLDSDHAVAVVEERAINGPGGKTRWARTSHGKWLPSSELVPFRPSRFEGAEISAGALDFAWVSAEGAPVYAQPMPRGKPTSKLARGTKVAWREEHVAASGGGVMVRISDDGSTPSFWMRARDLVRPVASTPPDQGAVTANARWVDIDLGAQTLVAYEGATPVFATLVSTGRGEGATPAGVYHVVAKDRSLDLDGLAVDDDEDDAKERSTVEDAPFVQRLDGGLALFGAFWHHDFGRPHGRTGVNLAPKDAARLFEFTAPHLPAAWDSVRPTELEPGTVVRIRAGT